MQRVQSVPPAEGSYSWGQDNCSYTFSNGAWHSIDLCLVVHTRTIYDTYKATALAHVRGPAETELHNRQHCPASCSSSVSGSRSTSRKTRHTTRLFFVRLLMQK